jgi:hypothetical protein
MCKCANCLEASGGLFHIAGTRREASGSARLSVLLLLIGLLFVNVIYGQHTDTAKKWPDVPDFKAHIAPTLSFFERNKRRSSFDTVVDFTDQGFGPVDDYYNCVVSGHLFLPHQQHAIISYNYGLVDWMTKSRLTVLKKSKTGSWRRVLNDTLTGTWCDPRYIDWNSDGIADLSYVSNGWNNGGHGPISWAVWLMDKNGMPRRFKGFDNLNDPQIDSFTHHIFSNDLAQHQYMILTEYRIEGMKLVKLRQYEYDITDDEVVSEIRHGKVVRKFRLKKGEKIYTPLRRVNDEIWGENWDR